MGNYQSGSLQLLSWKNRQIRRQSTVAWSCSHLNREAQGSMKQKCSEDWKHLQVHSPALRDHQRLPFSLPVQECCRLDIPAEPALPGLKNLHQPMGMQAGNNFFCVLNSQFGLWASLGALLLLSLWSIASLVFIFSFILLSRPGSPSCLCCHVLPLFLGRIFA